MGKQVPHDGSSTVNIVTDEVYGERPYSWIKILLTALTAPLAAASATPCGACTQ